MVCLFCLKETNDGVTICGRSELAERARNIITKHFWFDVNEIDVVASYACSNCWSKVESFHEFYVAVETNHHEKVNSNETKMFGNSLLDCEPESIIDEPSVKVGVHQVDTPVSGYETVFVPSTSYWNDSKKQIDSLADETHLMPTALNRTSDAVPTIKQEVVSADQCTSLERKREPKTQNTKLTLRQRKNATSKSKLKLKPTRTKSVRTVEEIVCYICHKPFASFRGVRKHFHVVHDPAESFTYTCDLCDRKYCRIDALKMHMLYHECREKYDEILRKQRTKTTCPICQKELTRGRLKGHILSMHENKKPIKHMCEVCGKGFENPSVLKEHALCHIDRKISQKQCDVCGKWVKNENTLRIHKSTHIQVPKKCPFCDKVKMNRIALTSHIRFAHSEPKYPCTFCDKSLRSPKRLREHIATHTGESLYNCLYCTRTFKNNANMYKHMREQHLQQWNLDRAKK